MKSIKFLTASAVLSTALTSVAAAQTIDYGTLESIFGEPVTTSATGKPQRASEAPVAMEILTAEDIRRSGAKDIPQLLQRVAGVEVNRGTIGRADVSIRGYNQPYSNRTLVLVNGRQILQDAYGQTPWERMGIQMTEIRQIEVVKGPQSALFGFNAENGVINIITYSPLADDISVAEVKFGTQQHRQASAVHTAKLADNMAVRVSGGVVDSDGFARDEYFGNTTNSIGQGSDDAHTARAGAIDYEWKVTDDSVLRAQLTFANGASDQLQPLSGNIRRQEETVNYHLDYKVKSDYGLWTLTAYRNSFDANGSYEADLNVLKAENLFKVGSDHTFRVAGEYRHNSATGNIFGDGDNRAQYELFAPSAMWDWKINDKLAWTTSVRYDLVNMGRQGGIQGNANARLDRSIEEISYNTGVKYAVDNRNSLRAGLSRGLHIPSMIESMSSRLIGVDYNGAAPGTPNLYFVGNPDLNTERNTTLEFGYDHKFADDASTLSASVFWEKIEDVLAADLYYDGAFGATDGYTSFSNAADSQAFGLELAYKSTYNDWLRWGANYTYMLVDDENNDGGSAALYYESSQPEHQLSLYGGFDHGNWEFDADLNYVSAKTDYVLTTIAATTAAGTASENHDGYFVLNTRVGYNLSENTSFELTGYNLIDRHREWQRVSSNSQLNGAETLGRTVLVGMRHKF